MRVEIESTEFSFQCLAAGRFVGKPGWLHPEKQPGSYELILMLEGQLTLQEGILAHQLQPGEMLVLSSEMPRFGIAPTNHDLSFFWMEFTLDNLDAVGLRSSCKLPTEDTQLHILFSQLLEMVGRKDYPARAIDYAALSLLAEAAAAQRRAAVDAPKLLQQISRYIRQNITTPITAAEVGVRFSYNADYLTALFKEYFGIGIKEYINEQKIEQAKRLLRTTEDPIHTVGKKLGFSTANQFIKYFVYHTGLSPARYRKSYFARKVGEA